MIFLHMAGNGIQVPLTNVTLAKYPIQCPVTHKMVTVNQSQTQHDGTKKMVETVMLMKYRAGKEVGLVIVPPPNISQTTGIPPTQQELATKAANELAEKKKNKIKLQGTDDEDEDGDIRESIREQLHDAEDYFARKTRQRIRRSLRASFEKHRMRSRLDRLYTQLGESSLLQDDLGQSGDVDNNGAPMLNQVECTILGDFKTVFKKELGVELTAGVLTRYATDCPLTFKTFEERDANGVGIGRWLIMRYRAGKMDGIIVPDTQPTAGDKTKNSTNAGKLVNDDPAALAAAAESIAAAEKIIKEKRAEQAAQAVAAKAQAAKEVPA